MRLTTGILTLGFTNVIPIIVLVYLGIISPDGTVPSPLAHSIVEALVAAMGILFAIYAFRSFRATGSLRLLIIALGLLIAGLLAVGHGVFQYTAVEWQRAFWYGRLAQLFIAVTLFLAGGIDERLVEKGNRASVLVVTVLLSLFLFVAFVFGAEMGLKYNLVTSVMQTDPAARFLQLASVILLATTFVRFLYGAFVIRSEIALLFSVGIFLLVMHDLTFASIMKLYDTHFWIAHVWKMLAYFAFLSGILVARHVSREESARTSVPPPTMQSPAGRARRG
ncbi:hypothetical protein HY478_02100 [Candidatus Uhrbacteria bacterium]|nr:hypothetical protein [Candidatus Uhrbacteria bacterium]